MTALINTAVAADRLANPDPANPDPAITVRWGEQSGEEMAVCFVDFLLPLPVSPNELFRAPRGVK